MDGFYWEAKVPDAKSSGGAKCPDRNPSVKRDLVRP